MNAQHVLDCLGQVLMLTKIILLRNPCDRELRLIEIILFDAAKTRSQPLQIP